MKRRINTAGVMFASLVGVMAMIAASRPAHADNAEICVSDDLGFVIASIEAEITPVTIKLVKGTYNTNNTAFETDPQATFQGFSLLGGYTDNCASRQIDAANTIITSNGGNAVLFGYMAGDLTVEGITFVGQYDSGLFLTWDDQVNSINDSVHVTIRSNIFAGPGDGIYLEWRVDNSHSLSARLVDNLVHDYAEGSGACVLDFQTDHDVDATFTLINNTVVNNFADQGAVCLRNGGTLSAYNNIFYGTQNLAGTAPSIDLYSSTSSLILADNVIGHHTYPAPIVPPVGTLTGDPKLLANFHPIESPVSPVINSGDNTVPGGLPATDLDGGPRVVGTKVDRGAYESSIKDALIQVVKNTNDSGADSLRTAIASINANGSGLITFNISTGSCPQVITLASELPAVTHGGIINGYTQAGASANDLDTGDDATLCVILESGNSSVTHGLQVPSGAGDAAALSIKGLGFSGFSDAAIDLQGGSGHFVAGNHFGGSVGGHSLQPNGIDIRLGTAAHDATIGSDDLADRNIIGDATGSGIVMQGGGPPLAGTYNNQILNNYIGVGWNVGASNYTNRGNGARGIHLLGYNNTLSGNLIGDNLQAGILVDGYGAVNNIIDGNFIGADADGMVLGNGNAGIHFTGASGDAPSGNTIRYNTITNNSDEGVLVSIGRGNKIRKNSIYANGLLGIALVTEDVLPNDDDGAIQPNDYANRGQNFPVLTSAAGGNHSGRVSGMLTSTGGDYTVDLYASGSCDASGYGEGQTWLKGATVTVTVPQGLHEDTATFAISFTTPLLLFSGEAITATATDQAGDTSEFSTCMSYLNDTIFADGFEPH
jgi:parallel beta-helix repeat protein